MGGRRPDRGNLQKDSNAPSWGLYSIRLYVYVYMYIYIHLLCQCLQTHVQCLKAMVVDFFIVCKHIF